MKTPMFAILVLGLAFRLAGQEGTPLPKAIPIERAPAIIADRCSACHDWAASPAAIRASGRVVPGKPAESQLWLRIDDGSMPPEGDQLPTEESDAIRAWVERGDFAAAPGAGAGSADALTAATGGEPASVTAPFLGFPSKVAFHRFSGWASGGLLLAAGGMGLVRALTLQSAGHEYRDANGGEDAFDDGTSPLCAAEITSLWEADQWLRWTHVGLLVAGEGLYLADAATGISFIDPGARGISRSKLHRWAFFVHGGLMVAEAVLGFITTDALKSGDHELVSGLGVAHAAIGFAIPVVILGAGTIMSLP